MFSLIPFVDACFLAAALPNPSWVTELTAASLWRTNPAEIKNEEINR